jgi:predicted Fe-Mo cluster-binding NifX family protein
MKIAVTSTGPTLDDAVEPRFGRCPFFLIIDPDSLEFESIQNPNMGLGGGAGIQSAQLMATKEVSVVLTGNCGPNAFQTFEAAGIRVITGVNGPVRQALEKYKTGALSTASTPNVESHFGMGGGRGMGRGMGIGGGPGMGRGMGMGGGRGMGRGMGMGQGIGGGQPSVPPSNVPAPEPRDSAAEATMLKEQVDALQKQLEQMRTRIKELEPNEEPPRES